MRTHLELVQAAFQGVFGARKRGEKVSERVLAAAPCGHDVIEILLKG